MIPFIRSITELMVITKARVQSNKSVEAPKATTVLEENKKSKRYNRTKDKIEVKLPNFPKITMRKWSKGKKAVSKLIDELDYNNQIKSSYDLTLLERYKNYDKNDVA